MTLCARDNASTRWRAGYPIRCGCHAVVASAMSDGSRQLLRAICAMRLTAIVIASGASIERSSMNGCAGMIERAILDHYNP